MSVGWMGEEEVVEVVRNGSIAWIAVLRERVVEEEAREVEGDADEWDLVRSVTFIDAAEPGMRLTSVGALRKSVSVVEAG